MNARSTDASQFLPLAGYEDDFALWAIQQAARLRSGDPIDVERIAEEIEDLSKRERHAIESGLIVIELHLLKTRYQPERASESWRRSIREHARRIQRRLRDSPSLRQAMPALIADAYESAYARAGEETGISIDAFPLDPSPELIDEVVASLESARRPRPR